MPGGLLVCELQAYTCVPAQSPQGKLSWCAAVPRRAVLAFAGVLLLALLAGAAFWAVRAVRRRVGAGAGAGGGGRVAGGASGGGRGLGLGYGGQRFRAFENEQEQELMPRAGGGAHPHPNPTSITILPLPGSPLPGMPAARLSNPGDLPTAR